MSEKKNSVLSKKIKIGKDSYPTKTSMNFIVDEEAKTNKASLILFGIFLVALVLFTKFGVIDTLSKTNELQSNYTSAESQNETLSESLKDYDQVQEKYNEMIGDFLNEDEANSLNRNDIIAMLDEDVLPSVSITNFSITGNQVSVYTGVTDLNTVSKVLAILQNDERTEYVTVSRTLADSDDESKVTADIEITYQNIEGGNE